MFEFYEFYIPANEFYSERYKFYIPANQFTRCGLLTQVHACIQACLDTCVSTKGALLFFSSEAPLGFIHLHWGQPRDSSLVHLH